MNLEESTHLQKNHQAKMNKKAQEEMLGFVLIMLVVAVIFVIFLGLYIRQGAIVEETDSIEISQFLEAIFEYTTDCGPITSPYKIRNLIIKCHMDSTEMCLSGRDVCDELRYELRELTEASWDFSENSPTRGYLLSVIREAPGGEISVFCPDPSNIPSDTSCAISGGESTTRTRSAEKPLPDGIILRLVIGV